MLFVTGCSSILAPQPDPARFYLIAPMAGDARTAAARNDLSIGVGPVNLPEYVQRQALVVRTSPTEVRPSDIDYWAEPLGQNVTRVLGENLGALVGTDRIFAFPSPGILKTDYQVVVTFLSFEQDSAHQGVLSARWEIRVPKSETVLITRVTSVTKPAAGAGMDGGVAALSAALADLSRDIAAAVPAHTGRPSH